MEAFTIHASKDGKWVETQGTSPTLTVAKANTLLKTGWDVHITDSDGRRYGPTRFNEVLSFEPPRDCRRLQLLRRWSHDKQDDEQILT